MGNFLNPAIIARGSEPAKIESPLDVARGVREVQQLGEQAQLAPLKLQQSAADVQATQLANQKTQRDVDEQKAFGQDLATSGGDPDKIEAAANKHITNPVVLDRLKAAAAQIRQRNEATTAKQHTDYAQQSEMYAGKLQGIIDAKDPALKLGLWSQTAQQAAAMKDENGQPLFQPGQLDPTKVPDDQTLASLQTYMDHSGAFHAKQAKIKDDDAKAQQAQQKAANDRRMQLHSEADDFFQSRNIQSKDDYDAAVSEFGSEDAEHKSYADRYLAPVPYSSKALGTISRRALTPEQRVKSDEADATRGLTLQQRNEQAARDSETKRHNQSMEAIDSAKAARERGETANRTAQDRAGWERELNKLKEEEEQTGAIRANLENAIHYGNTYVDEAGKTRPMKTAAKDDNTSETDLQARMRSQYQMMTNRAKRIAADKNSLGEQLGMQLKVPTPAIHASLDKDLNRVLGVPLPAKATAPPPATPTASPTAATKTFPRGRLAEYATANKMTPAQAEAALKKRGWSIAEDQPAAPPANQ
jgi:hypothetical protein